ncbi:MAG: hypothetical protein ACTSW1_11995 [Candidatus Hodarchaeales archaeon]
MGLAMAGKTKFLCKLCGYEVKFDIEDPSTYMSKSEHDQFFGMQLTTFRVPHIHSSEIHINTILVDHKGFFRGHIDAYSEPIDQVTQNFPRIVEKILRPAPSSLLEKPIFEHKFFEILLLIDRTELTYLDIILPRNLKPFNITEEILRKLTDAERIYNELPIKMTLNIADKIFTVWSDESKAFTSIIKRDLISPDVNQLIHGILRIFRENKNLRPNKKSLFIVFNAISSLDLKFKDLPLLKRVLTDELLFSRISIKYPEHIPQIASRLSKDFFIPLNVLIPALRGEIPIIDLLYGDYFKDTFLMLDFIKRRRLLE